MTSTFFPQLWRKLAEVELDYAIEHAAGERQKLEHGRKIAREFALLAGIPMGVCASIAKSAKEVGDEEDELPSKRPFKELVTLVLERSLAKKDVCG